MPETDPAKDRSEKVLPLADATLPHSENCKPASAGRKVLDSVLGLGWDVAGIGANVFFYSAIAPVWWLQNNISPQKGLALPKDGSKTKVAIIGAGASGVSCAWTLNQTEGYDFTLFEKEEKIGGHAYSFPVTQKDGTVQPMDMGFIFGHFRSYSNLMEIMDKHGTKRTDTELSISCDVDGIKYRTNSRVSGDPNPGTMHPDGRAECDRFHALCERFVDNCAWNMVPFQWFLNAFGFSEEFKKIYLLPILIVLFISEDGLWNYSSRFLFNMFAGPNKFIDLRYSCKTFTIKGGTEQWLKDVSASFQDNIRCSTPVRQVRRITENGVNKVLVVTNQGTEVYDHVIMCTGAKVTSMILQNQTWKEKFVFSNVRYAGAPAVLHTDQSFLPSGKDSRNFSMVVKGDSHELSGDMGRVAGFKSSDPRAILTLDPGRDIPADKILKEKYCAIHVQDMKHLVLTRLVLPSMQGEGNVWFGNSWVTWLGHSGAIDSGICSAMRLGAQNPLSDPVAVQFLEENSRDMYTMRFNWKTPVRPLKSKL
mmetsp:Transcript_340/g.645  ORF Transcript_340/g.645 Transcript_340/m.645 type:complete len:535 (+) Transcript_340:40-1644(+)|eukprot:CAMPEP_0175131256 /NCGR_PEP_ID=MMETSP0087-20121206/6442_1 /TAXON_ID=136419 /ORGANISM="Unknown Unknown, Strain D1" /LENGTH=534 /DNA_ID=CAMNT_0016413527 /DNA_START=40 /DNA_END=1644 /DNA_ORIENTATION=+